MVNVLLQTQYILLLLSSLILSYFPLPLDLDFARDAVSVAMRRCSYSFYIQHSSSSTLGQLEHQMVSNVVRIPTVLPQTVVAATIVVDRYFGWNTAPFILNHQKPTHFADATNILN